MTRLPMLEDILGQVQSLERVFDYYRGGGHAALLTCSDTLRRCSETVIISGMGASFFASLPTAQSLEQHGVRVRHAESAELLHFGEGSCRTWRC